MELLEDREVASLRPQLAAPRDATEKSFTDMRRGIHSGEICVRMLRNVLCAENGAAHGLAPALRALAIEPPTLQQMMAPWRRKLEQIQKKRLFIQEKKRLVRKRYDAVKAAVGGLVEEPRELVYARCARRESSVLAFDRYVSFFHSLERLYAKYALSAVLEHYALLEEERAWIAAWRVREMAGCQQLARDVKRRHHIDSFAVHLESETLGQIRMRRLVDGDAQRARCAKAASENIKKGFFGSDVKARIEIKDVYKVENQPLLRGFERWINEAPAGDCKVKGLFCCVPTESLERVVVCGMFADEAEWARWTDSVDNPVFNRPNVKLQIHRTKEQEAPGTGPRAIARRRVLEAEALQFPRRFSRYSTLDELRGLSQKDLAMDESPIRYLALCRVAMGKIQRVANMPTTISESEFPNNASVGSLLHSEEEEYVIRYAQSVVPEFIIEYRFIHSDNQQAEEHESRNRIIPVSPSTRRDEPRPSEMLEYAALRLVDALSKHSPSRHNQVISMFAEKFDLPSIFTPSRKPVSRGKQSIPDRLSTETTLDVYRRRRREFVRDLQSLQRQLPQHAKSAWDILNCTVRRAAPKKTVVDEVAASEANTQNQNEAGKQRSMKARKLYGELALVRQLQAQDVAKLDDLIKKTKPVTNGKFKQKRDPPKPRPFR